MKVCCKISNAVDAFKHASETAAFMEAKLHMPMHMSLKIYMLAEMIR